MKICVVPGSFDPFTLGHLDVVRRASGLFDRVYVAIMINQSKKGFLPMLERKQIAELSCSGLPNVSVITAEGLLVDLCAALHADTVVKGARNALDFEYERDLADINRRLAPSVETLILPSRPELTCVSSTFVRELTVHGRSLHGLVAPEAEEILSRHGGD